MTINQLRYFLSIARHQNFRKASEELFLSQPNLSKSMAKLEEELQVKLFRKEGRGIVLTEEGRILEQDAKRILEDVDLTIQHLQQAKEDRESTFCIGSTNLALQGYLPTAISGFIQSTDDLVKVEHVILSHRPYKQYLEDGSCDLIIEPQPATDSSISSHLFIHQPYVLIVPKKHPLAKSNKTSISLAELAEEDWILPSTTSQHYARVMELMQDAHLTPKVRQTSFLTTVTYSMVAQGSGIAIVTLNPYLMQEGIKILTIEGCQIYNDLYLSWRTDKPMKKSVADFIQYVKEYA